jgi:hypothetical protein
MFDNPDIGIMSDNPDIYFELFDSPDIYFELFNQQLIYIYADNHVDLLILIDG